MRLQWWGWDRLRYKRASDRVGLQWWGWDRQTCNREGEGLMYRLVGGWLEGVGWRPLVGGRSCRAFLLAAQVLCDLGFRVKGLGFRFWVLGFRGWGLGFRV